VSVDLPPVSYADETDENAPQRMTQAPAGPASSLFGAPAASGDTSALQTELAEMKEQALRAMAEVENIRRRSQRDREDASKYAVASFARDLLDVADTFRRALDAVPEDVRDSDPRVAGLVEGIEATERKMLDTFARNGIRKIEPLEEPFDPNFHEVMFETPIAGKTAGTVIQVLEPGYVLHDRLLRPARVGVSKESDEPHVPLVDEEA
jgi:molecular chaperone GrpE